METTENLCSNPCQLVFACLIAMDSARLKVFKAKSEASFPAFASFNATFPKHVKRAWYVWIWLCNVDGFRQKDIQVLWNSHILKGPQSQHAALIVCDVHCWSLIACRFIGSELSGFFQLPSKERMAYSRLDECFLGEDWACNHGMGNQDNPISDLHEILWFLMIYIYILLSTFAARSWPRRRACWCPLLSEPSPVNRERERVAQGQRTKGFLAQTDRQTYNAGAIYHKKTTWRKSFLLWWRDAVSVSMVEVSVSISAWQALLTIATQNWCKLHVMVTHSHHKELCGRFVAKAQTACCTPVWPAPCICLYPWNASWLAHCKRSWLLPPAVQEHPRTHLEAVCAKTKSEQLTARPKTAPPFPGLQA